METSILRNIKKLLGLFDDDTSFDMDILTHINSVLSVLKQVGMQVPTDLLVEDANATWGDLLNSSENLSVCCSTPQSLRSRFHRSRILVRNLSGESMC